MVGRARENLPGGSIKYLLRCLNIRIFKCRYRTTTTTPTATATATKNNNTKIYYATLHYTNCTTLH